ncbi:hypothetical protein ACFFQF_32205 [Haladaptatus pallidirubidus]|nr:hypothetical protein [Haladaptatus pallidirubidus]
MQDTDHNRYWRANECADPNAPQQAASTDRTATADTGGTVRLL